MFYQKGLKPKGTIVVVNQEVRCTFMNNSCCDQELDSYYLSVKPFFTEVTRVFMVTFSWYEKAFASLYMDGKYKER